MEQVSGALSGVPSGIATVAGELMRRGSCLEAWLLEYCTIQCTATSVALILVASFGYIAFLRYTSKGPTSGFGQLDTKAAGGGAASGAWTIVKSAEEDGVSWLGVRELRSLEAICDTLLPGFETRSREGADATIEQTVAVVSANLFHGKNHTPTSTSPTTAIAEDLPPALQAYTRKLAERCLRMSGRPASDIGVAGLLAKAYQVNLPHEQRSGLQVLLWVLNTRVGAFLLTGRAIPLPRQSFAARHALLRRWSRSRIGKLREAFQGVKRLSCSLYFSAHSEATPTTSSEDSAEKLTSRQSSFFTMMDDASVSSSSSPRSHATSVGSTPTSANPNVYNYNSIPLSRTPTSTTTSTGASKISDFSNAFAGPLSTAEAALKTNPSWRDIRYDPQHQRLAREACMAATTPTAPATKPRLWTGAKVKVAQAARAARAASSPTLRNVSNPPSPANSSTNPATIASAAHPRFFTRAQSASTFNSTTNFSQNQAWRGSGPNGTGNTMGGGGTHSKSSPGFPRAPCHERSSSSTDSSASTTGTTGSDSYIPSDVDVVVVGSGAGGGCVAGTLALQGLKVAVLEKGGTYDAVDFARFSEMEAYRAMYEKQGVITSDDAGVVLLAGSCVGGGTTVNWTASFRTPRHVRIEWAQRLGLKSFRLGGPFDRALDAVCDRLGVNTELSHRAPFCPAPPPSLRVSHHNCSLWNGATASGLLPRPVPRNAKGCVDCGSCLHGCASGSKRSTKTTWLQDGLDSGNVVIIPNAEVEKVLIENGMATGVTARVTPPFGGKPYSATVHSRAVVVSGGAIHTPAILLRSGLKHPLIGRHLRLHPVMFVGGVFPEDYSEAWDEDGSFARGDSGLGYSVKQPKARTSTESKASASRGKEGAGALTRRNVSHRSPDFGRGVMMGVFVQDWMRLNRGYGVVIETPPMHPGLMALCIPWNDAISHRLCIGMARETSVFLCIARDRSCADNRIVLGPTGDPVIKYSLEKEDSQVLIQGRSEMLRLMRKAGASLLIPAHEGAPWFCPTEGKDRDGEFEEYVENIEGMGTTINQAGVCSAHQMGSCRLSATPESGPLRESGETWECNGLFVADASVFPTSLGINPMITVEAVAYMVAEQVATRLGKENWPAGPGSGSDHSPIRRRVKSFGKAVIAAMSRDTSHPTDYSTYEEAGFRENRRAQTPPRSRRSSHGSWSRGHLLGTGRATGTSGEPYRWIGRAGSKVECTAMDDFGVDLSKLAW